MKRYKCKDPGCSYCLAGIKAVQNRFLDDHLKQMKEAKTQE